MIRSALFAAALAATAVAGQAAVLDFEGATTTGANRILDRDGANAHGPSLLDYAGYDWLGMAVASPLVSVGRPQQITGIVNDPEDGPTPVTTAVDAGFHRSMVSGNTVAFTTSSAGATSLFASMSARPGDANFSFISTYVTSAYRQNVDFTVTGLRDGVTLYSRSVVLGNEGPTLLDLNFLNIDEIRFVGSGGTFLYPNGSGIGSYRNPSNAFSTPVVAFDNMTVAPVPEPSTYALMAAGLGILGFAVRRRQRRS